jgi:hypothetical protein
MNFANTLRLKRHLVPVLLLLLVALAGFRFWRSMPVAMGGDNPQREMTEQQRKAVLSAELRDGLGREVRFTNPDDSDKEVNQSVESLANFIQARSGMELSAAIKERLATLELETLAGKRSRISVDELCDALTETGLERAATLTDEEIEHAAQSLQNGGSNGKYVLLRASGKGYMKTPEFIANVHSVRNQLAKGDAGINILARAAIGGEVKDRIQFYSEALPEQFGSAGKDGLTPLQAAIVTYSAASDDLLLLSPRSLQRQVEREERDLRAMGVSQPLAPKSDKAYGVNGRRFSTPLDLVMDEKTMGSLLERVDKLTSERRTEP